jgi:hypothetical protein
MHHPSFLNLHILTLVGTKRLFWHSGWIDGHAPAKLFPLLYNHSRRKQRTVREAMLGGNWIGDIAHDLNNEILREFFQLWNAIESAQLNLDDGRDDQISWILESSGEYSTKSAYNIQFARQIPTMFLNLIWNAWAAPKCKFFLWLLLQDKLWTAACLQIRGWKNNYFCAVCERNLETAAHLFMECPYAATVWTLVVNWSGCYSLHPSQWTNELDIEDWFS